MVRNRSWDMEIKRVRHHSPEMLPDLYKIVDAGLCAAEVRLTKKRRASVNPALFYRPSPPLSLM